MVFSVGFLGFSLGLTGLQHAKDDFGGGLAGHDGIRGTARHRLGAADHHSLCHERHIAVHVHTQIAVHVCVCIVLDI